MRSPQCTSRDAIFQHHCKDPCTSFQSAEVTVAIAKTVVTVAIAKTANEAEKLVHRCSVVRCLIHSHTDG